jgi:hypothetical protein
MEAGLVFDRQGDPIHWHLPPDRTGVALPDSRALWKVLWENRHRLGGVAHTHPWAGPSAPSVIDVTTFAAIEAGLGQRLIWPIVTFTAVGYFVWFGPEEDTPPPARRLFAVDRLSYAAVAGRFRLGRESIDTLRELSR